MKDYIIPHNYKDNGRIFGMFEKRHFFHAMIWCIPATLGLLAVPLFGLKLKVFLLILVVAPPTIIILMGFLDIAVYMRDHSGRAGVYHHPDQKDETAGEPAKKQKSGFGYKDLVPLRRIKSGVVTRQDGRFVRNLCVLPINFKLKSKLERQAIILAFEDFLRSLGISFQVTVLTQKAEIADYLTPLRNRPELQQNEALRRLADSYAEMVTGLEESGTVSRRFVLSYTYPLGPKQKPEDVSDEAVRRYFQDMDDRIRQYLQSCGNDLTADPDQDQDFHLAQLHSTALCRHNHDLDQIEEVELWGVRENYAEQITPRCIDATNPGYLKVDDKYIASQVVAWIRGFDNRRNPAEVAVRG